MESFSPAVLAVVGAGLMGSSILRAVRAGNPQVVLLGFDAEQAVRARLEELKLCDQVVASLEALRDAELVVICVPVAATIDVILELANQVGFKGIVTDVASVKQPVIEGTRDRLPADFVFVPGHPMAGGERGGPDAGRAELFLDKACLLTPLEGTPRDVVAFVEAFWRSLGARTQQVSPQVHDRMVAITSHLPHLLAFALMDTLGPELPAQPDPHSFIGNSLREQIRLACSEPTVWEHIFTGNRAELCLQLERFESMLGEWRAILSHGARSLPQRIGASRSLALRLAGRV